MSVQPIYYSVDEDVCKNVLVAISQGMLQEIPSYGPSCAELSAQQQMQSELGAVPTTAATAVAATPQSQQAEPDGRRGGDNPLLMWSILILLILLLGFQIKDHCERRSDRKKVKLTELQAKPSSAAGQPLPTERDLVGGGALETEAADPENRQ